MKALIYNGPRDVTVKDVPDAGIDEEKLPPVLDRTHDEVEFLLTIEQGGGLELATELERVLTGGRGHASPRKKLR